MGCEANRCSIASRAVILARMETGTAQTIRDLTPVLAEPAEGAERVTEALPGEPLQVVETRDGWARIRTAYD